MTFRQFYEQVEAIPKPEYKIYTRYTAEHEKIIYLIDKLEAKQKKNLDNLRYKYLPKKLDFDAEVTTAVMTEYMRFINENEKYKKELEKLPEGSFIGYWTTVRKAIFYTKDRRSLRQFVIPKKGLLIPQEKEIEVIKKNDIRQRRSDCKYRNLGEVGVVQVEGEVLPKKLFRYRSV